MKDAKYLSLSLLKFEQSLITWEGAVEEPREERFTIKKISGEIGGEKRRASTKGQRRRGKKPATMPG